MIAQTAIKKVSDSSDQLNLNQPSAISAIGISAISAIAATTIAETDFSSFLIKAGFHMIVTIANRSDYVKTAPQRS